MRRFLMLFAAIALALITGYDIHAVTQPRSGQALSPLDQCSGRSPCRPSAPKALDQLCNLARHNDKSVQQIDHASVITELVRPLRGRWPARRPATTLIAQGTETNHDLNRTSPTTAGKLVIATIGGTSLDDIAAEGLPNISRLIERGAVGIMNTRPTSGLGGSGDIPITGYSMAGSCATIGAGTRTGVTSDARRAYSSFEQVEERSAQELYTSRYGRSPGSAEVVHLGMNRLKFVNSEANYPIEPGALGDALHQTGLKTAVVGNSDTPTEHYREAALIAADGNGIIDFGDTSARLLTRDADAPYGVRTNVGRLISQFRRVLPKADLIVVDVGDTERAAKYARHCTEDQGKKLGREAIESADSIIGKIAASLDLDHDRIIVVSTNPSPLAVEELDYLPPVIVAGKGIEQGLLTSGSTRRPGIITNADISVTVLDFFGVEAPYSFVGRSFTTTRGPVGELVTENRRIILQIERQPVMEGLAIFLIISVLLVSVYVIWFRREGRRWVDWAALVPVALMLAVIWLPAVANPGIIGAVAGLAGLTVGIVALSWLILRSPIRAFAWMCASLTLTVLIDLARGPVLLRESIMSYTPTEGARYYGIGNYQMGCAIAAAMITVAFAASLLSSRRTIRTYALPIMLLVMVAAIGLPSTGANAGGGISAAVAAVVGWMLWSGRRIDRRFIAAVVIAVPAVLALIILIDTYHQGLGQSHVGRAARMIAGGGVVEMWTIIQRKIGMNLSLLSGTPWGKLLGILVAAIIAAAAAAGQRGLRVLQANQDLYRGIIAATLGALAALIFNDSGVVAASTALIYVWTAIILAALHEEKGRGRVTPPPLEQTKRVRQKSAGH